MSAGMPPSGVVTFLFTDIEGSTRRWEADADRQGEEMTMARVAAYAYDQIDQARTELEQRN